MARFYFDTASEKGTYECKSNASQFSQISYCTLQSPGIRAGIRGNKLLNALYKIKAVLRNIL